MTQGELYSLLLVTLILVISGVSEISRQNWKLGTLMLGIPVCGWISIFAKGVY